MWKVRLSRWINYYLLRGKSNQTLSSRAYVEHMPRTERFINWVFRDPNHCRETFLWEARYERQST
jgi:hypothetical protein